MEMLVHLNFCTIRWQQLKRKYAHMLIKCSLLKHWRCEQTNKRNHSQLVTRCQVKTFCRYVHPKVLVHSLIAGSRYPVMPICLSVNKNRCFKAKLLMESYWINATLQRPRQVFLLKSENTFLIKCSTYHAHLVIRNAIIKKGKRKKGSPKTM